MRQYVEQKQQVGDAILLFRMGDFYETFYEDAKLAARVLGIALTSRSKGDNPIPLAGIPYHALEAYLSKLVKAGHKVAISEQVEDPKTAKGVVKRAVVRVVTAGTLTDEALLDERCENVLAAVCVHGGEVGIADIELASGRFRVFEVLRDGAVDELIRLGPAEVLLPGDEFGSGGSDDPAFRLAEEVRALCGATITRRAEHTFAPFNTEQALLSHFQVGTLAGFGFEEMDASLCAAGALIAYLQETQKTSLGHVQKLERRFTSQYMGLDRNTWRSLEIERTLRGGQRQGSLLAAMDRTVHPIGARALRRWVAMPLVEAAGIVARQQGVQEFVDQASMRQQVRRTLRDLADIERITARVALARASPRDLAALSRTLLRLPELRATLAEADTTILHETGTALGGTDELAEHLKRAIREDAPITVREGGIIAAGFDEELDRLRGIRSDGQSWLAKYQQEQIARAEIPSLKVGFNRVFGYYIEISNTHRDRVPAEYVRKQTIKNAERYITDELKQYETEVLTAEERANELEYRLFEELRARVAGDMALLQRVADAMGRLDVLASLAELAVERRYVRPQIVEGPALHIADGRHPVLDQMLGNDFVPNDTEMPAGGDRVLVITGPNMAGKSTYIRQVALLVLMGQTGSFVPAGSMRFSLVDRLFARVGASDEIARGQSTFMVEMSEAANILNNATGRSLIVLDEIGRGTSTFDGLSLAWAITEHLANQIKCRTLVATHYHEMTELEELLEGVRNYNVAVREWQGADDKEDSLVFLHKIVPGGADKSYGVHVARLAGIPKVVVRRSKVILDELQKGFSRESHTTRIAGARTRQDEQLLLFEDPAATVAKRLAQINPDDTTPIEALKLLKELCEELGM
ncbi:MAG: DNA mismatch repair protein MutS [Phycisphaerae bacterium]|nr:DNA mismatch repair protein MutS [Phycisphaerae bacterium]